MLTVLHVTTTPSLPEAVQSLTKDQALATFDIGERGCAEAERRSTQDCFLQQQALENVLGLTGSAKKKLCQSAGSASTHGALQESKPAAAGWQGNTIITGVR